MTDYENIKTEKDQKRDEKHLTVCICNGTTSYRYRCYEEGLLVEKYGIVITPRSGGIAVQSPPITLSTD